VRGLRSSSYRRSAVARSGRVPTATHSVAGLLPHQLTRVGPGELDEAELRSACRDLLVMALA
jgi:hypothetical protein